MDQLEKFPLIILVSCSWDGRAEYCHLVAKSKLQSLVIFFIHCWVFQPAFACCAHSKAGRNIFFRCFSTFLFISKLFQWFHGKNQQKTSENEHKAMITLQGMADLWFTSVSLFTNVFLGEIKKMTRKWRPKVNKTKPA